MGALILPSRFNQQPQRAAPLDLANPLTAGMVHCWGLNVAAPRVAYNAASSAHGSFGVGNGGTSGNSWQIGQAGYYINYDATGTGTAASLALAVGDSSGSGSPKSNIFSFAFRFRLSSLGGSPSALYGSLNSGGIEIRVDTTGIVQMLSQGVALVGASTLAVTPNSDVDLVVTYDGAVVKFYINGKASGSASSVTTFLQGMQYYLGYASSSSEFLNVARLYRADIWKRVLTESEAAQWSSNPWQVYKAPVRRLWNSAASGDITGSFTVSEGSDTGAASGSVASTSVSGTLAVSEGADTLASSGVVAASTVTGTLARSEGPDTATGTGATAFATITGTATVSEGSDTAQASGAIGNAAMGTLARQEGSDTLAAAGAVAYPAVTASLARQEAADSLVASGSLLFSITGMMAAIELPDTLQASSPAPAAPKLNLYTTMRDSPVNVSTPLGALVNLAGTMLPSVVNLYTTMRIPAVNMTGNLGAPVNITGNLL